MSTRLSSTLTIERPVFASQEANDMSVVLANQVRLMQSMKSVYQADQQAKLLNLQADVETLLHQLQSLKEHRSTSDENEVSTYNTKG